MSLMSLLSWLYLGLPSPRQQTDFPSLAIARLEEHKRPCCQFVQSCWQAGCLVGSPGNSLDCCCQSEAGCDDQQARLTHSSPPPVSPPASPSRPACPPPSSFHLSSLRASCNPPTGA